MRVGLIGAGALGALHTVNLAAVPDCRLLAVASEQVSPAAPEVVRSRGADTGGVEEVLDPERVDAVIIATPTDTHAHHALLAFARHGSLVDGDGAVTHVRYGRSMDAELLDDWLTAIRLGSAPPVPMEDGWKATQVALAALTSARYGTVVDITDQEDGSA
ncbi:Gfo/Idh/MocA family oxidoreductase [Streptomyces sp. NPDC029004]|uniref:Gfo/Idh/MocA family oxidoreductase n=1 Tax=Streptomyces sp. NPDC029004 TaxID=3154490 RepID=UPI0033D9834A